MAVHGADIDQLRALALALGRGAHALEEARQGVGRQLNGGTAWTGPDATQFRADWDGRVAALLGSVSAALDAAAGALRRNADEQEVASNDHGATGHSGGGGGGGGGGGWGSPVDDRRTGGTTADLLKLIHGSGDGVRIHRIIGADGQERFIVYIDGTGSAGNPWLPWNRNSWLDAGASAASGLTNTERHVAEQMRQHGIDSSSDVLLVGYSQGGAVAQLIAQSGEFGAPMVVTKGAPEVFGPAGGGDILRLEADGDIVSGPVDGLAEGLNMLGGAVVGPPPGQDITFRGDPGLSWQDKAMGKVHTSHEGYERVADQFDASTDPAHAAFRDKLARFQNGRIVGGAD